MSIRTLPELPAPEGLSGVAFEVAPVALSTWESLPTAAAEPKDETTITILDPIGASIFSEGVSAKRIAGALRAIGKRPVTVLLNSPGGDFFEGMAIYNLLRSHPAEVTVHVLGIAASAAAVVAMAGDTVMIAKSGIVMVHNSQWVVAGDRNAMSEAADTMAVFDQAMRGLFVDRTGLTDKQVGAMLDAETFLSSQEAIDKGFADELLPADKAANGPKASAEERPLAYRIEAVMARHGVPRGERRRLIKEIAAGMPRAPGDDDGMPGAAECAEGLAHLRAAAMRLSLTR